ncbi:lactonase family protein [Erysipelothrix sp. HDW6C]|uniref:lactonase family protein n=1 Tax=Erysipelothrix sp. HDW6C TaxID=2714930 RepID=UPI001408A9C6|nr:lactonase family protein [Erysipelothrix sp. HDW6C]QIK70554.1 lactonase family protein [Erysipelothrix sp. HDW6C]
MQKILLGTYTRRISEGIYSIDLDPTTKTLKNLDLVTKVQNATYLDFDESTQTLYSVYQDDKLGGIAVWDYKDGKATLDYTRVDEGVQPCYVSYHPAEASIYEANYHDGSVTVTRNRKKDKVIEYKTGSHAHFIDFDPKTDNVFVCDLGTDTVHKYQLMNEIATYKTTPGMGPRHIAFHPTAPILYVFGELNNTIEVVRDDEFDLVLLQAISTLPEGFDGKSGGAAIRISDDGRYVYASNRGHDSIAVFAVNDDFTLTFLETVSTEGEHPRDFAISPDQKFMVVANLMTDNLTLFARDEATGLLSLLEKGIFAPEVVCVKFIGE